MVNNWSNPLIEQRADPFILCHLNRYYSIASVPKYDRLEARRATTLEGLRDAESVVVWHTPQSGPMSRLIWAPELHEIGGKWYIYFIVTRIHDLGALGMFRHRMSVPECTGNDPLAGRWQEKGQMVTPLDTFALDTTTFVHQGERWYLWMQKSPHIEGNPNLYLVRMANPWTLKGEPVILSKPKFDWERRGFKVNEGPAVLVHGNKLFVSYSANATDKNYYTRLLWIDRQTDPLQLANWHRASQPVFRTNYENCQYDPDHNSFTQMLAGEDVPVYHTRNYTEIEGDPPYDPNRHTRSRPASWRGDGMPDFGVPPADVLQRFGMKPADAGSAGWASAARSVCEVSQGMRCNRPSVGPDR